MEDRVKNKELASKQTTDGDVAATVEECVRKENVSGLEKRGNELRGVFERGLKHGYVNIPGKQKSVFVPEHVIRIMSIQQGAILKIEKIGLLGNGNPKYHFHFVDRSEQEDDSNRVGVTGHLEYRNGEYGVFSKDEEAFITVSRKDVEIL